ncbi:MAG: PrsW family intramembrane metalloprotease [Deltaproteobacteria bacterium]|nr:PrsW family intramembrane metalloprotease [Deltaproteobacteria bacterium]
MPGFLTVLSVGAAVVPILGFLLVLWWMDRYDREPAWLFALVFLWGAVGAVVFAAAGSLAAVYPLQAALGARIATHTATVLVAPLVEEPVKAAILFLLPLSRHFDNTTDGFVYGGAAGLGFGMSENLVYFVGLSTNGDPVGWMGTVLVRTFYSALMHAASSGLVGAALGFTLFRSPRIRILAVATGFLLAMTMHGVWNGLLIADEILETHGALFELDLLVFPLEFFVVLAIFQFCLWDERRVLLRELTEEASLGVLPHEHVALLASWIRRSGRGWLPRGVPHAAYIRSATTLAFRKQQSRAGRGPGVVARQADVERLREEIRRLLSPAG